MVTFLNAQSLLSERYRRSASLRVSTAIHVSPHDMGQRLSLDILEQPHGLTSTALHSAIMYNFRQGSTRIMTNPIAVIASEMVLFRGQGKVDVAGSHRYRR
jgi:hypothetical protein